jgi:hypothetical protein
MLVSLDVTATTLSPQSESLSGSTGIVFPVSGYVATIDVEMVVLQAPVIAGTMRKTL